MNKSFSSEIKDIVQKRDGCKCCKCGGVRKLEIHHLIPKSAGGSNDETNLVTLCRKCHKQVERSTGPSSHPRYLTKPLTKKTTFPAKINSNLSFRIPEAARKQMMLKKGDLLTVEIRKEQKA